MARSFGASGGQVFWKVSVPAAAPMLATGVSVGTLRGVKGMIMGEMVVAFTGLGSLLKAYGARFDTVSTLALLLVILCVSFATQVLVGAIGRGVVRRFSAPATDPLWPSAAWPASGTATENDARTR